MTLDPQAKALLDGLAADASAPKLYNLPPEAAREFYKSLGSVADLQAVPIGKVEDVSIPGPGGEIPLRIYTPVAAGGGSPALVFFHGGGWVIGDLDTA